MIVGNGTGDDDVGGAGDDDVGGAGVDDTGGVGVGDDVVGVGVADGLPDLVALADGLAEVLTTAGPVAGGGLAPPAHVTLNGDPADTAGAGLVTTRTTLPDAGTSVLNVIGFTACVPGCAKLIVIGPAFVEFGTG